jgi:hypothetical protein
MKFILLTLSFILLLCAPVYHYDIIKVKQENLFMITRWKNNGVQIVKVDTMKLWNGTVEYKVYSK